jgi:Na+-transporting methylmalonyl-CoA/oxaloacetate decarboxylase gamma subunit
MLDWERNWRGAGVVFVVLVIVAFCYTAISRSSARRLPSSSRSSMATARGS